MDNLVIITPVKDSIDTTLDTIDSIKGSHLKRPYTYTIYNDFSSKENFKILQEKTKELDFSLVNLEEITNHPSPNYRTTLQLSQKEALKNNAALLIVESDVVVKNDTIQRMFEKANELKDCGMVAAVTVDQQGEINFPYLYAKKEKDKELNTKKRLSFCCTLLHVELLKKLDFATLDESKSWYDVFVSHQSKKLGFNNYLLTNLPVLHQPHSSRPWKQLKYTNPIKYYWLKYTKGLDKI